MSQRHDFAANRRALSEALDDLAAYLGAHLDGAALPLSTYSVTPPALAELSRALGLSRFEQDVLLLAAAADLEPGFQSLLAKAQGDPHKPWLSFGVALAALPNPEWTAVTPIGRLRRWRLLEPVGEVGPMEARLAVDENIVHAIGGVRYPDPRLEPWFRPQPEVPPSEWDYMDDGVALEIAERWQQAPSLAEVPLVRVAGFMAESFIAQLASRLKLKHHRLRAHALPHGQQEREALARLWEREGLLRNAMLSVDPRGLGTDEERRLADFLDGLQGLVILLADTRVALARTVRRYDLTGVSGEQRLQCWRRHLGDGRALPDEQLAAVAEQFHLSNAAIERIARYWRPEGADRAPDLWTACRTEARAGLDRLARRVESRAGWDDLVLPKAALLSLRTIAAQVRQRARVYRDWGFADMGGRGLGISALFAGGSGTGKTLAAEVLANELRLDLYRIDLAAMVSKYIGETEKNLSRVFEAAEVSGAILLFDEADALFGKRSEVRDSHDRYANLEVSYLLQRIETYRGLVILTTNLKQALDSAFQRRIRFIVHFPFPDEEARGAIWQRVFPRETPLDALDVGKLARLSLSGGHIRNLALNAAFLAADDNTAVGMRHLRIAAEAEFAKLEKPLPQAHVGDWV